MSKQMNSNTEEYEVWEDTDSSMLATKSVVMQSKEKGLLSESAKFLFKFEAATPEEANAIFHLRMGFEPYKPIGEPKVCPNCCGSHYFPEGSSVCPICGEIKDGDT